MEDRLYNLLVYLHLNLLDFLLGNLVHNQALDQV